MKDKEYYIATNEDGEFLIYKSEIFTLSEIDLINLIKICLIEARSKSIGKKILGVYEDSTKKRKELTQQRLKMIGVKNEGEKEPTRTKRPKLK